VGKKGEQWGEGKDRKKRDGKGGEEGRKGQGQFF